MDDWAALWFGPCAIFYGTMLRQGTGVDCDLVMAYVQYAIALGLKQSHAKAEIDDLEAIMSATELAAARREGASGTIVGRPTLQSWRVSLISPRFPGPIAPAPRRGRG